jgi:Icc-related predicted phosphoesterase
MRILACADLHGVPERTACVRDLIAEVSPDVVVLAGDIAGFEDEADSLEALRSPVPVLAVPGNMDGAEAVVALTRKGWLLSDAPRELGGFTFAGSRVRGTVDVMVVHRPPEGTLDQTPGGDHIGSPGVREAMRAVRPRVLACGHVHESPGVERVGATLVVNCSMGAGKVRGALIVLERESVRAELV